MIVSDDRRLLQFPALSASAIYNPPFREVRKKSAEIEIETN
jgi:hypothetical protein